MVVSFFASVAYLWYAYYLVAYAVCLRRIYANAAEDAVIAPAKTAATSSPLIRSFAVEETEMTTPSINVRSVAQADPFGQRKSFPAYKVAPFIHAIWVCLAQTFTNFEIIVINDGSPGHARA